MTLVWSDTGITECPSCGATVVVGIMSLSAACACGFYYVDVNEYRGWYSSRAAYQRGDDAIPVPPTIPTGGTS